MNLMLVIIALIIETSSGHLINHPRWVAFLERHGKKYHNGTEHATRFQLWSKCEETVASLNAAPGSTFTAACPHFADWTHEEKKSSLFGAKPPGRQFAQTPASLNFTNTLASIPSSVGESIFLYKTNQ
jgi:hypothetical protein